MLQTITVQTQDQQLIEISAMVQNLLDKAPASEGLITLFIKHTSASLLVQENADPDVQYDLLRWMNRLVPEDPDYFTHTNEGDDDMPAHIKSMLTQSSVAIPFQNRQLMLGTWQGLFLFEHRRGSHARSVIAHMQA